MNSAASHANLSLTPRVCTCGHRHSTARFPGVELLRAGAGRGWLPQALEMTAEQNPQEENYYPKEVIKLGQPLVTCWNSKKSRGQILP